MVFCGRGIGVFECRHWCFCGRGIGVFVGVGRGIGVCEAQCAGATVFFWEKTCEPRKKTRKTLMRGRDGQAKGSSSAISCEKTADRRRGSATDSSRPAVTVRAAAACMQHGRPARRRRRRSRAERERRTDRRNLEFARAAVRLLRGTDGNTVQRTAPPTAPPPLTTTRTGWHWSSSSSRPGREEESRRSCESCDLRQQKNWKRQATDGQVGQAS